jgi:hypothetical protein
VSFSVTGGKAPTLPQLRVGEPLVARKARKAEKGCNDPARQASNDALRYAVCFGAFRTAKEVRGPSILKLDLKMCLAKASANHKDHNESHLPVVFFFVSFVNFVVKHYPQVSGPGASGTPRDSRQPKTVVREGPGKWPEPMAECSMKAQVGDYYRSKKPFSSECLPCIIICRRCQCLKDVLASFSTLARL